MVRSRNFFKTRPRTPIRFPLGSGSARKLQCSNHREGRLTLRICSSSSGVKSFTMLKILRISSTDFPFIIPATVLQPCGKNKTLIRRLMRRKQKISLTKIEQILHVEVVGCQDEFEEQSLVHLHEFFVPVADVFDGLRLPCVRVLDGRWIALVVCGISDH